MVDAERTRGNPRLSAEARAAIHGVMRRLSLLVVLALAGCASSGAGASGGGSGGTGGGAPGGGAGGGQGGSRLDGELGFPLRAQVFVSRVLPDGGVDLGSARVLLADDTGPYVQYCAHAPPNDARVTALEATLTTDAGMLLQQTYDGTNASFALTVADTFADGGVLERSRRVARSGTFAVTWLDNSWMRGTVELRFANPDGGGELSLTGGFAAEYCGAER